MMFILSPRVGKLAGHYGALLFMVIGPVILRGRDAQLSFPQTRLKSYLAICQLHLLQGFSLSHDGPF